MNTVKFVLLTTAVVVGIPAASAFTAHRFGSDSLAVRIDAPARSGMEHDELCTVNDTPPAYFTPFKSGESYRPGHA